MNRFKILVRNLIKAFSGYELRGSDRGFYALTKSNVEAHFFDVGSLLLVDKIGDELVRAKEIHDYLRKSRLKKILSKYQINIVLDVGANKGQFARELRSIGCQGRIISFEPILSAFEVLSEAAINDLKWDTFHLALGSQEGEKKMYVADASVFTSFLKSNSWCEQQFGKSSAGTREETVTVRRLDNVLEELVGDLTTANFYLKMDTQGYDLEVFAGLGSLCDRVAALQSEISVIPIYENMPHLTESISIFEKAGFELAGMHPVSEQKSSLRIIEFDCFIVNARLAKELYIASFVQQALQKLRQFLSNL